MSLTHLEERRKRVREAVATVDENRAKMRRDELDENIARAADGSWYLCDADRRPVPSAVIWTEQAGRVRCMTVEAFDAIASGAPSHPDAKPEPVAQIQRPRHAYSDDGAFWCAVLRRCRQALGQKEPVTS